MTLNLSPKTRTVAAATIRVGHVVMESHEHPAQVTEIRRGAGGRLNIWARFVWQASKEPQWLLGSFQPNAPIEKAVR